VLSAFPAVNSNSNDSARPEVGPYPDTARERAACLATTV
jgi:hypothetical protein